MTKKIKSEEEIKEELDFDKLYQYVRKEIFNYDENQALPRSIYLGLRGFKTGKIVENNNIKATANYPYEVVLLTFIYCKKSIDYRLKTINFKTEKQAFNYISKIIRDNLNEVYVKYKTKAKEKELVNKIENVEVSKVEYKKRSEDIKNNKLKELW